MIEDSAMFPTPDRAGDSPVQAFGIPVEDSALIVGADRSGKVVVAPVGIPLDDAPLVGVADRSRRQVGVALTSEFLEGVYMWLNFSGHWGSAIATVDDWTCSPWSDGFNRANGDPKLLPNYPWELPSWQADKANIAANVLSGNVMSGGGSGGAVQWMGGKKVSLPAKIRVAKINATNITYNVDGGLHFLRWEFGLRLPPNPDWWFGTLFVGKHDDPPLHDGLAWYKVYAYNCGVGNLSAEVTKPNLSAIFGNSFKVIITREEVKTTFLGTMVTA